MIDSGCYVGALDEIARDGLRAVVVGGALRALLVTTAFAFDPSHRTVADITAAELALDGYTRQDLVGACFTDDEPLGPRVAADDLAFGSIAPGDRIPAVVVFRAAPRDEDAMLVVCAAFDDDARGRPPATSGGAVSVLWGERGMITLRPAGTSRTTIALNQFDPAAVYAARDNPLNQRWSRGRS